MTLTSTTSNLNIYLKPGELFVNSTLEVVIELCCSNMCHVQMKIVGWASVSITNEFTFQLNLP